jgi:transglutaminase-like putative cysteine protease
LKQKFFLGLTLLSVITSLRAQDYSAAAISAELKENAAAVLRRSSDKFIQKDINNGSYTVDYVVTILNSRGNHYAAINIHEDFFQELKSFSGEVFDASGKSVKKISKKDLLTIEFSFDLATNGRYNLYESHYPTYPFTVRYRYEIKCKNGILIYPTVAPAADGLSIEKADYILQIPTDYVLREKKLNTNIEAQTEVLLNGKQYKWSITDWKAVTAERFAPVRELFPIIYLSPEKFCLRGVCGSMESWATFGLWNASLFKGRDILPQKIIDKVLELTKDITQTKDRVKVLYEYLQATTHYVSIQLGIGGWQPLSATDVAKTGFGDCKALSNYMRALLKVVDIPSCYVVISTKNKRFFSDYPSFSQVNHVIVMVPLPGDTIWLECTNQTLPFGYIHKSIAGHDALAIDENNAFFCTLPDNNPLDNQEINTVDMYISSDGYAEFNVHSTYKMDVFERMYYKLKGLSTKEENDILGSLLAVQKPKVSNYKKIEILTERPEMNIYYTIKCDEYASKTGSRMFIPANPALLSLKNIFIGNTREQPIEMKSGIHKADTIRVHIPAGYVIETTPKPTEIKSDYGYFNAQIKEEDGILTYIQILELQPRRYAASEFKDIKDFYNRVENFQTSTISLKKVTASF